MDELHIVLHDDDDDDVVGSNWPYLALWRGSITKAVWNDIVEISIGIRRCVMYWYSSNP